MMGDSLQRKMKKERLKRLKKELFAKPLKAKATDADRVAKLESLVIALFETFEYVQVNTHCAHERWNYLIQEHEFELSHLGAAAIAAKIRRDKGVCSSCDGDAHVCYPRHAEGRSCG